MPVAPVDVDEHAKSLFSHYATAEKLVAAIRGALDRGGELYFRVELKRGG